MGQTSAGIRVFEFGMICTWWEVGGFFVVCNWSHPSKATASGWFFYVLVVSCAVWLGLLLRVLTQREVVVALQCVSCGWV